MVDSTVYKAVTYQGKGNGTLKLYDNQLTFQMFDIEAVNNTKIFTLPWKKVKKRQVASSGQTDKPKFKLILKSGTQAIFQMDDRISLEVLRDDIAERLKRYKAQYPDSDEEAVNITKNRQSARRMSTPYRMAKPEPETHPKQQRRVSTPYRMAQKTPQNAARSAPATKPTEERKSQPYRMVKKDRPTERESQPYRYAAKWIKWMPCLEKKLKIQ